MKVTVALGSNRPGGLDMSLHGLAHQTFGDFEVIFPDGRYARRHDAVLEAVTRFGVKQPFFHVPNHRSSGDGWSTISAGVNTALALAEGDLIVLLMDYAYCPPDWLDAHVQAQTARPRLVMAPYEYRDPVPELLRPISGHSIEWFGHERAGAGMTFDKIRAQHEIFDEITSFIEPFTPALLERFPVAKGQDVKTTMAAGPQSHVYMHLKNESFPRQAAYAAGGMAEFYDRGQGPGDNEFGYRLLHHDLEGYVEPAARITCINPRPFLPNPMYVMGENERLPPPHAHRLCYKDCMAHYNETMQKKRKRIENPRSLETLRKELWHWRNLSQQSAAVLAPDIIRDEVYFA